MASDSWREVSVNELASQVPNALATGPFGSSISAKFFQQVGVPVIRGSNLSDNVGTRLNDEDLVFLSNEKGQEFARSIVRDGDLIFTCWGTIGQVGLIDGRTRYREYVISNKQMKLTPNYDIADSLFLYYLFSGPDMYRRITGQAIGSSVPGFNLGQLRSLRVLLPPLAEQHAIAHILGTLDDKIELNQRTNETLETIAQALFRSWFVEFDLVRAKAEGRQPMEVDQETVALFPDGFQESQLGRIPEGWQTGRLDDLLLLHRGYDLPASERVTGPYEVISGNGPSGSHIVAKVKGPGVVIRRSGVLGLGKVFFVQDDFWPLNTALYVSEFRVSRPLHAYHLLSALDFAVFDGGSAVPTLNRNHIHSLPAIIPEGRIIERFETICLPIFNKLLANRQQSITLADIRDALLPKLLSGDIRVKDAEQVVSAAL